MKKKKKILSRIGLTVAVFCSVFAIAGAIKAASLTGWNWGGSDDGNMTGAGKIMSGLGWISMSNKNCDTNDDGKSEGGTLGCPAAGTSLAKYGVTIPTTDGDLGGYAWSENVGWIAFGDSDGYLSGCPSGNGACSARRVGNNLEGWARIVSIATASAAGNSGGWNGWIKLNIADPAKSVKVDSTTGKLSGYALSGNGSGGFELGYIDFSRAIVAPGPAAPTVTLSANPPSIDMDKYPTWKSDNGGKGTKITLSWNISADATNCKGDWDGVAINNLHSSADTYQNVASKTYTITCDNDGRGSVQVSTGCHMKACSNNACAPTWETTATNDNAKCVADAKCSTDNDCQPRTGTGWQEVAP